MLKVLECSINEPCPAVLTDVGKIRDHLFLKPETLIPNIHICTVFTSTDRSHSMLYRLKVGKDTEIHLSLSVEVSRLQNFGEAMISTLPQRSFEKTEMSQSTDR